MYVKQTREQIDAANKYHTWCRGYRDGFSCLAKRKDHAQHPTLGETYREAYDTGFIAGNKMREEAAKRFGYATSILRTTDANEDTETGGTSDETNESEGQ